MRTLKRLLLPIVVLCVIAQGQSKPERQLISLSPEASRQWIDLNLRIENMRLQQQLIQARNQIPIPGDYHLAGTDDKGQVVFAPPVKPETAKASSTPEKK